MIQQHGPFTELADPASAFARYEPALRALPAGALTKEDLLTRAYRLHDDGDVSVYYAPIGWMNPGAQVALVGITPGWQQMEIAARAAVELLAAGNAPDDLLREGKRRAAFAGGMRRNLVSMLPPRRIGFAATRALS